MNRRSFSVQVLSIALSVTVVMAVAVLLLSTPATAQLVDVTETDDGWVYVWDPDFELTAENYTAADVSVGGAAPVGGAPVGTGAPEPTSLALAALGCIVLLTYAWRWCRRSASPA